MSLVTLGYTQTNDTKPVFLNFAAPNAASFNKFIDNPIGLYNGIPDVSIPIYQLKDGMIDIPITLRYNTSGIKVAEEASWVGLGWNLNVGGIITQMTVGVSDADINKKAYKDYICPDNNVKSIFEKYEILNEANNYGYRSPLEDFYAFKNVSNQYGKDTHISPDVYYLSIPGFGGKFVIDNEIAYFLKKESNIKIEFWNTVTSDKHGALSINPYFKVTTEDGIIHYFEKQNPTINQIGINKTISCQYLLKETEYPNGQRVYYEYATVTSARLLFNESVCVSKDELIGINYSQTKTEYHGIANYYNSNDISKRYITQYDHYLTKITTTNYILTFGTESREDMLYHKKLKTITIEPKVQGSIPIRKEFSFYSSYFEAEIKPGCENNRWFSYATVNNYCAVDANKRLRLDSIAETQGSNNRLNTYRFKYNQTKLPPIDSYAVDYWGLYNGKQDNETFLPNLKYIIGYKKDELSSKLSAYTNKTASYIVPAFFVPGVRTHFACRAYDFNYAKAGMLETIIYPTGGVMRYIFEPNTFLDDFLPDVAHLSDIDTYTSSLKCNNNGCGIRIQAIEFKEKENSINLIKTNFNYNKPGTDESSGILHSKIAFYNPILSLMGLYKYDKCYNTNGYEYTCKKCYHNIQDNIEITSDNSMSNPYEFTNGVGYSYVEETKQADNVTTGSIAHYFHNKRDIDNRGNGGYGLSNNVYENGNSSNSKNFSISDPGNGLDSIIMYLDASRQTVKYEEFYYNFNRMKFLWGVRTVDNINLFSGMYSYPSGLINNDYYQCMYCVDQTEGGFMIYFDFDLDLPPQYLFSSFTFEDMYSMPRFTFTRFEIPCYSVKLNEKITTIDGISRYDDYTYNPNTLQLIKESVDDGNGWNGTEFTGNLMVKTYKYPNDFNCEPYITMTNKNIINKVIEIKTFKANNLVTSTYNEYASTCLYMPSKRYYSELLNPVTNNPLTLTVGSTSIIPNSNIYPRTNVLFDHYDSFGNMTSVSQIDGKKAVYLWSYNHQFPIAEIWNATYVEVLAALGYTSDTEMETLSTNLTPDVGTIRNKLTSYFTGKPVLITTYTYKAFEGIQTKTDPRGVTTYYTYDSFGRLMDIKNDDGKLLNKYNYHYRNN